MVGQLSCDGKFEGEFIFFLVCLGVGLIIENYNMINYILFKCVIYFVVYFFLLSDVWGYIYNVLIMIVNFFVRKLEDIICINNNVCII